MKMKLKLKTYKKNIIRIIILIPLSLTTLKSISQTSDSSVTCIPNSELRIAIKKIENCKILQEELDLTQVGVALLKDRIKIKDSIIRNYDLVEDEYKNKIKIYDSQISNLNLQVANQKSISNIYRAISKKNKYIYGFGGLVIGVIVTLIAK